MSNTIYIEPDDLELIAHVDSIECEHPSVSDMRAILAHDDLFDRQFAMVESGLLSKKNTHPPSADCIQRYRAVHFSGRRPLSVIDLQVIHDQESATALAAASWFAHQQSAGSATYTNDDIHCYRCLRDDQVPWGAPGANYHGLHYEQAGFAAWKPITWKRHLKTIDRTAWKVARDARRYGIEIRWLDAAHLKRGMRNGQTSHRMCTAAFGGSHTDPGRYYPVQYFMKRVRVHHEDLRHQVRRVA